MSDFLTTLRELSVAFYFFSRETTPSNITPHRFLEACCNGIKRIDKMRIVHHFEGTSFTNEQLITINNGLKLGHKIREVLKLQDPIIEWVGGDTHSGTPIDLVIDGHRFSLKEQSFILENMGLYKLLNILSGNESVERGCHIFETFSMDELKNWFNVTRDLLINLGPSTFSHKGSDYYSAGTLSAGNLNLEFTKGRKTKKSTISNFSSCTYDRFQNQTVSTTREQVFSKWIKIQVASDATYTKAKATCAKMAGERLVYSVGSVANTIPENLLRFFRIQEKEHYYAKSTENALEIYRVPALEECSRTIQVKSFRYNVPSSQLNILTEIENIVNSKKIILRNELRYSHGQFNGTPEAKLYVQEGDLSVVYEKLC